MQREARGGQWFYTHLAHEVREGPARPPVPRPVHVVEFHFIVDDRFERLIFPLQCQIEGAAERVHRSPDVEDLRDAHGDPYF